MKIVEQNSCVQEEVDSGFSTSESPVNGYKGDFSSSSEHASSAPMNPFVRPVVNLLSQIKSIDWQFPYIAQVVQLLVLFFVTALMLILTCTVGIAAQIGEIFFNLLSESTSRVRSGTFAESSAYAICSGIYLFLYLPFWILQLPFLALGWMWSVSRTLAMVTFILFATIGYLIFLDSKTSFTWLNAIWKNIYVAIM